jgi:hypothetical protein
MGIIAEFVDVPNNLVWSTELTSRDENMVNDAWYREDNLLVELDGQEPFVGKTRWCDLEMIHYQLLLFKAFDYMKPDTQVTTYNIEHRQPFLTFTFLTSCIVKFNKLNGLDGFDRVIVSRPFSPNVNVDFRKVYRFDWNRYVPPSPQTQSLTTTKTNPFHVVVDNTK